MVKDGKTDVSTLRDLTQTSERALHASCTVAASATKRWISCLEHRTDVWKAAGLMVAEIIPPLSPEAVVANQISALVDKKQLLRIIWGHRRQSCVSVW
ncbi:hypothetical protein N7495_007399 [Penicillium taxi]|uniref:uncharacterized protein n=1 Tax=Penicillium taxi TaxID=168475 RepID=UPI002545B07F|nr:uncharacterized protein N7495_007399 [Penicillium taxi]KAJ5887358.1 hypothetical protein N7495_007399 [Penicillium taxi]